MTKEFFASSVVEREAQPPLRLSYSIVCGANTFGAEIIMDCDGARHCACVPDITPSKQKIIWLLQTLRKHHVTPCTLEDVVVDLWNET